MPFTIVFWDETFDETLNDSTSDVHHTMTDSIVSKVSVKNESEQNQLNLQGLSVPFACVGSGDPVRVLRLYTTNTLDIL